MFEFNKDVKTRDVIIFGEYAPEKYMGGTRQFENMSYEKAKVLLELGYIDPDDAQNNSPTAEDMLKYAEEWGGYTFDGYVVSIDRCDYRVTLTTISKTAFSAIIDEDEVKAFTKMFRNADEFDVDGSLYAWYD